MALCPNASNPTASITEGLKLWSSPPYGEDEDFPGDYSVAGVGTRNFGTGVIKLKDIPPGATILEAWLIYNTYQSNNEPNPSVTLNGNPGGATSLFGIAGSTCWLNPGSEPTTYLRNRVYVKNVTSIVTGNGNYTVAGLPVDLAMPIGTDGDRLPGCKCSQGAILFVPWNWASDKGPSKDEIRLRGINVYLGARLLTPNPGFWGGGVSYNLPFQPVKSTVDEQYFKGNTNIIPVAGDAQATLQGDTFAINQVQFVPLRNAWTKVGPSLSIRKYSVAQIYDGENSAYAATNNDCINWFFFAISGDKTQPKAQFEVVNCAATALDENAEADATTIKVYSNYVDDSQTEAGGKCRAVKFDKGFVGPPAPGQNQPGMFPAAPFYISIDKEIMKVTKKEGNGGALAADGYPDPDIWTVQRGQSATTPAFHKVGTCIYMLSPPRWIKDMQSGLAPRGQPRQRPRAGRPRGRFRR